MYSPASPAPNVLWKNDWSSSARLCRSRGHSNACERQRNVQAPNPSLPHRAARGPTISESSVSGAFVAAEYLYKDWPVQRAQGGVMRATNGRCDAMMRTSDRFELVRVVGAPSCGTHKYRERGERGGEGEVNNAP